MGGRGREYLFCTCMTKLNTTFTPHVPLTCHSMLGPSSRTWIEGLGADTIQYQYMVIMLCNLSHIKYHTSHARHEEVASLLAKALMDAYCLVVVPLRTTCDIRS